MSKHLVLEVLSRDVKKEKPNQARKEGFIPAVVYGGGLEARSIKVEAISFRKTLEKAGETDLIDLRIDGAEPIKVLVHSVDRDIKNLPIHVDFFRVNMQKKLTVTIPLIFVGESRAVKELGGTLIKAIDHLEVECLPNALVHSIEIDLSALSEMGSQITLADVKLPAGIELQGHNEGMVASVVTSGSQSVEAPAPVVEAPVAPAPVTPEKK